MIQGNNVAIVRVDMSKAACTRVLATIVGLLVYTSCDIFDPDGRYCPESRYFGVSVYSGDTTGFSGWMKATGSYERCSEMNVETQQVSKPVGQATDGSTTRHFLDQTNTMEVLIERAGGVGPIFVSYFRQGGEVVDTLQPGVPTYHRIQHY